MTIEEAAAIMMSGSDNAKMQPLNVSANGIYYPPTGYDGFSKVTVGVSPELVSLGVSENGTYYPPEDKDGFDVVRVNCSDRYNEGYKDGYNDAVEMLTDTGDDKTENDDDGTYTFPGGGVDTDENDPFGFMNMLWATGSGYLTDTMTGWCLCYTFTQRTDSENAKLHVWCENIKTGAYDGILNGGYSFLLKNIRFTITGTNPTEMFNTISDAYRPSTGEYYTTYTEDTRVSAHTGLTALFRGTHKYVTSCQKPTYSTSIAT